ncbi:MAG: hypothetical protein OXN83_04685 [Oligoflexia bacterium]|nr:hypothetical protein [Oligoflexia bacterium]
MKLYKEKIMKKIKFFSIAGFFGVIIFLVYVLLFPFSKIHSIDLKTTPEIKKDPLYIQKEPDIVSYLQNYKGQYLWKINLKKIVKKIEAVYLGGDIYIKRKFPNRLIVSLDKEKTSLLLLKQDHFFYSVFYDGNVGSRKSRTDSLNFPILRGKSFETSFQLRRRVLSILSDIPKAGNSFSLENISEIFYNEDNDSLLFYLAEDYFILELQSPPSLKIVQNIDFVLNYLKQQGRTRALIDVRLNKKIIVKKIN